MKFAILPRAEAILDFNEPAIATKPWRAALPPAPSPPIHLKIAGSPFPMPLPPSKDCNHPAAWVLLFDSSWLHFELPFAHARMDAKNGGGSFVPWVYVMVLRLCR